MYQSTTAQFQTLKTIDTATFTGSYQLVGVLSLPARVVKIVNGSNTAVTVSFDGTTDHDYFAASNGTPSMYNFGTNRGESSPALELPQGTPIYAKGAAGVGLFTVSCVSAFTPTMTIPQ